MKNIIFLFDFIMRYYGDREITIVNSKQLDSYRSEKMSYFKMLVEKQKEIRITDFITKGDFICTSTTIIEYFTFINDKIIIYF